MVWGWGDKTNLFYIMLTRPHRRRRRRLQASNQSTSGQYWFLFHFIDFLSVLGSRQYTHQFYERTDIDIQNDYFSIGIHYPCATPASSEEAVVVKG